MKRVLLSVLCCGTLYGGAFAFQAQHVATPNAAHIGDEISYTLHIYTNSDETLKRPVINTQLGAFSVLQHEVTEDEDNGITHYQLIRHIATYQMGALMVPTQTIPITHKGKTISKILAAIPITITSIRSSTADIQVASVKPPLPLAGRWFFWVLIATIGVCGALIIAAIMLYKNRHALMSRFKNQTSSTVSPKEFALHQIATLRGQKADNETDQIAIYDAISDCLRTYLSATLEKGFMERTTAECHALLRKIELDQGAIAQIISVLTRCDEAKFANTIAPAALSDTLSKSEAIINAVHNSLIPSEEDAAQDGGKS
ncbi:MAG: hypothetical protein O3A01_02245 [bacterium]|nr:hypothetical protein [bacterium]